MTTPADRVAAHNARRHFHDADPLCSLCPDVLPIDDIKQEHPYIFNPAPRDHVVINGRLNSVRDVGYFYIAQYDSAPSALAAEPDSFMLLVIGRTGDAEIGTAYSEDAANKALLFMKQA
jgi:hypothetical protein